MNLHLTSIGLLGAVMALSPPDHLLLGGLPIVVGKASAENGGRVPRAPTVPPARDPAAAVAEEFELARQKGTADAFELFIVRHGDDPLAEKARAELKRLSR